MRQENFDLFFDEKMMNNLPKLSFLTQISSEIVSKSLFIHLNFDFVLIRCEKKEEETAAPAEEGEKKEEEACEKKEEVLDFLFQRRF